MRRVRSFVRREGRMTDGQRRALDTYWPQFGVEYQAVLLDLDQVFGRKAPRVLEIGFGMGQSLAAMAGAAPDTDYIGVEVYRPGVGSLLRELGNHDIKNVRVISEDAVQVLEQMIPDAALDRVQLFFPDPWPKKRHHKRRIVQPGFLDLLSRKIKKGGIFHMATDWEEYAQHMMEVATAHPSFVNECGDGEYAPRPDYRPMTRFEMRGQRLGHGVRDLLFRAD